jgi:hypothetical protein
MAESRSWAIILALAAQLATITVANGYLTDVGNNVWTTDGQRPSEDALGLMVYSEDIVGPGLDRERPGKPVRDFTMLVEAAIDTGLDDAQQQIHALIEDIEACMERYAEFQASTPGLQVTPMVVSDIDILDRPEGAPIIAMQARIVARYFR